MRVLIVTVFVLCVVWHLVLLPHWGSPRCFVCVSVYVCSCVLVSYDPVSRCPLYVLVISVEVVLYARSDCDCFRIVCSMRSGTVSSLGVPKMFPVCQCVCV